MSELQSVAQVSQSLGITTKTLYEMIRDGKVPHYRVGKKIRLNLAEVLQTMKVENEKRT